MAPGSQSRYGKITLNKGTGNRATHWSSVESIIRLLSQSWIESFPYGERYKLSSSANSCTTYCSSGQKGGLHGQGLLWLM